MAFAPIALTIPQYDELSLANWWLKAYEQGTTTPLAMATDATGGTTAARLQLDSDGFPVTAGNARIIPFIDGQYDLWCFPTAAEADANDTTNAIQFADNLNADSVSGSIPTNDQRYGPTFTTVTSMSGINPVAIDGSAVSLSDGMTVKVQGRNTINDGGAAEFDVVLTAGVVPNTWNIIESADDAAFSFVLREQASGVVLAKQWGYVADGATPNQDVVLQFIIDLKTSLLNDSGVTIDLGIGTGILSAELLIEQPNVRFIGTGKRNVYFAESAVSQPVRASATSPTTLMAVHSDRNLLRFYRPTGGPNTNEAGTFSSQGVTYATLETGSVPTACFGFDASGSFHRDYSFGQCAMAGFTAVFDMYDAVGTGVKQFAALKVVDCNIHRNGYIARNTDSTQWNNFVFQRNEAGQNGVVTGAVFDLRGQNILINEGNLLEGQPNTIRIQGNYKGIIIKGNYFEANSGDYVISLESTINSDVGPNYYQAVTATDHVKLFSCVSPTVDEDVNVFYDGCINVTDRNSVIGLPQSSSAINGGSIMQPFSKIAHHEKRSGGKTPEFFTVVAIENRFHNVDDSGGAIHDTTVDGDFTTRNATTTAYTAGDILCAVSMVSYDDLPTIAPRLLLNINTGGVDGASPGIFNNFDKGVLSFKERTFVMFSFAKAINTGNSTVAASIYPFGLGAPTGKIATFTTWIWNLGQDFDSIEPFVCPEMWERAEAAPLAGTWQVGETFKKRKGLGVAGGTDGFICTGTGTPGIWKTKGAIGV